MTENEAIFCIKAESESHSEICDECELYGKTGCDHCHDDAIELAIKALEEVQQYRAYKEKFKAIYGDCDNALEVILDLILKYEFEQMKGSYILRLLTDEDAKKWDEYKQIGTPEECRAAVEKQNADKEQ